MPKYIITKTTIETLGIEVESLAAANEAAHKGQGETMTIHTAFNVRPRPDQAQLTPVIMGKGGVPAPAVFGKPQPGA